MTPRRASTKRHKVLAVLSVMSSLVAMPVLAASAVKDTEVPELQVPASTGDLLSVAVSLFVVIGAILLCGWLYKRSQGLRGQSGGVFSIVASQALGPKERIIVIEVANKQLVLGMTATQVSTLHVFDEPVVQRRTGRRNERSDSSFADRFKSILWSNVK